MISDFLTKPLQGNLIREFRAVFMGHIELSEEYYFKIWKKRVEKENETGKYEEENKTGKQVMNRTYVRVVKEGVNKDRRENLVRSKDPGMRASTPSGR